MAILKFWHLGAPRAQTGPPTQKNLKIVIFQARALKISHNIDHVNQKSYQLKALSTTARLRWLAFLSLKILMILLLVKFHKLQKNGQCTVIKNGNNRSINHKFYLWMLRCKLCFTNANGIILQWSISNACVASLLKILDSSLLYICIYDCTPEAGVFLSLYHV